MYGGVRQILIHLAWASLTIVEPVIAHSTLYALDSLKSQGRETVTAKDTDLTQIQNEIPNVRKLKAASLLGGRTHQSQFAAELDSLFEKNPVLRGPFLKELLLPPDPIAGYRPHSVLKLFSEATAEDSTLTPFERMSLIARRYALSHDSDRSLKSCQVDIIGTIIWLRDVLK